MRDVYTLENLAETASLEKPARLAVLGDPVSHSASPRLHQPALDAEGIAASYIRFEVPTGAIAEAFAAMKELGFFGCNVTVPHKFEAMAHCDTIATGARTLGAVNTVIFRDGQTHGENTDGPGISAAISDEFKCALGDLEMVLFGAGGGAGQAIAMQCALEKVKSLTLVNRSIEKIEAIAKRVSEISPETKIRPITFTDADLVGLCHEAELLIQTTSLGLKPGDPAVVPDECFLPHHSVYDTIYKPAETPFLRSAKKKGCRTANGTSLLIHQGEIAFRHWFPDTNPLPLMRAAMEDAN